MIVRLKKQSYLAAAGHADVALEVPLDELGGGCFLGWLGQHRLGVLDGLEFNATTADGRFTLKEGECMGACAMAPVILVNNKKMHDYMSNEKIDALLKELK